MLGSTVGGRDRPLWLSGSLVWVRRGRGLGHRVLGFVGMQYAFVAVSPMPRSLLSSCDSEDIHVHCDSPCSQIADSQHTTDHVSAQVVENQNFPYWVSILV